MATETQEATTESQSSIAPYCPVCIAPLNKVYDADLECECWVCSDPDCGFIMPILDDY